MAERSVFFEEWRRCLQEHYREVIRHQDKTTEKTLVGVMHRVGFSDDELRQLYMEATIRADGTAVDFVPDMSRLPFEAHPAECSCAACMDKVLDKNHDKEGQPVTPEPEPEPVPEPAGNIYAGVDLDTMAADEFDDDVLSEEAVLEDEPLEEETVEAVEDKNKDNKDDGPKQLSMF